MKLTSEEWMCCSQVEMKLEMPPIVTFCRLQAVTSSTVSTCQVASLSLCLLFHSSLRFSLRVHASAQSNCCIARVTSLSWWQCHLQLLAVSQMNQSKWLVECQVCHSSLSQANNYHSYQLASGFTSFYLSSCACECIDEFSSLIYIIINSLLLLTLLCVSDCCYCCCLLIYWRWV